MWASHLPQLTANALAQVLQEQGITRADLGPGGRDMTRLAGSSATVWTDLLKSAAPGVATALDSLGRTLQDVARQLEEGRVGEVAAMMDTTKRWCEESRDGPTGPRSNESEVS